VAIDGDRIVAVGKVEGRGEREIDARGLLVTPGFVDAHTHYDGQAIWDSELAPSSWHGVTTAVFGNCGVGFAPVRPNTEQLLIELMEGVEDIPGTVLSEGLDFTWETFPEFLTALERRPRTIDVGAQVPHSALRFYVMGARGGDHFEQPTAEEIVKMANLTVEGVRAGALGFSTSRTHLHRTLKGKLVPTLTASTDELYGIAAALGELGQGVIEAVSDITDPDVAELEPEFNILRSISEISGRPLSLLLTQIDKYPNTWRDIMALVDRAVADGIDMRAQIAPRAVGVMCGLQATSNPFGSKPSYREIASLPLPERVAEMRRPERRAAILSEPLGSHQMSRVLHDSMDNLFELGEVPNYEPEPSSSIAAQAARLGISPSELAYDMMLRRDGEELLYYPLRNFASGNLDGVEEMMRHDRTVTGLSDGGAHAGAVCDASFPTFLLYYWGRDRQRGQRFPIERLVQMQTADTARLVGLYDRGILAPGYKADVNVIDFDRLQLRPPMMVHDLPAGGRRLVQKSVGYRHTICSGVETFTDGEPTGALPGKLVRGAQAAPNAGTPTGQSGATS
jgi:N-acyl-D-aspartate/D-glutamate deacylase